MAGERLPPAKRRGATHDPPNRFELFQRVPDLDQCAHDPDFATPLRVLKTDFFEDDSKSVISENDSPDLRFRYSLNPYRGCEHGCVYCYARPYHELLGWNAGLDFETKILVKRDAPRLLREFLARPAWRCEPIVLSGVTDCYQPIERELGITRQCLEVALEANQPVEIVTKNRLALRDVDLYRELARRRLVHANVAVTTLDPSLARAMEPRTAPPEKRLETIAGLAEAGVPARVLIAPVVPGLTDRELPSILRAARAAGARAASYVLLRLPGSVRPIFLDWLAQVYPEKQAMVEASIQATRGGAWSDPRFGSRMRGEGERAEQIQNLFRVFARKEGLDGALPPMDTSQFRTPIGADGQMYLF